MLLLHNPSKSSKLCVSSCWFEILKTQPIAWLAKKYKVRHIAEKNVVILKIDLISSWKFFAHKTNVDLCVVRICCGSAFDIIHTASERSREKDIHLKENSRNHQERNIYILLKKMQQLLLLIILLFIKEHKKRISMISQRYYWLSFLCTHCKKIVWSGK